MNSNELNQRSNSPFTWTICTIGRGLGVYGRTVQVRAWDIKQAIRETRKVVSRAWSLRLVSRERDGWPK